MNLAPNDNLPEHWLHRIAEAYALGHPERGTFVARGAMGAVYRITCGTGRDARHWTVKRSFWNHYDDHAIAQEVALTTRCGEAGIRAPRSVQLADGRGYVLTLAYPLGPPAQVRVLEWFEGETGNPDDPQTIEPLAAWMATIHKLAIAPGDQDVDPWYAQVSHDWHELVDRLATPEPELAAMIRTRLHELDELTSLVNTTPQPKTVVTHRDIGAENLIWTAEGPALIDWENAGPLAPVQELAPRVRSLGDAGPAAYRAYRKHDGPATLTTIADLTCSVAIHLNFLGSQSQLLLDAEHPEQHTFARANATAGARDIPTISSLEESLRGLD